MFDVDMYVDVVVSMIGRYSTEHIT